MSAPNPTLQPPAGRRQPTAPCRNCGDTTVGNYCPSCGQRKIEVRVSLRHMMLEVLDDQLALNSALPRTLGSLLFRPGHLSREYVNGRIVRYIPPLRLYLVTSVVFFLLLSFKSGGLNIDPQATAARQRQTAAAGAAPDTARPDTAAADTAGRRRLKMTAGKQWTGINVTTNLDSMAAERGGWLKTDSVNLGVPELNRVVEARLQELGQMTPRDAIRRVGGSFIDHVPQAMFLLLPVFAGLLALLYVRRRRFYVEHFVFALHVHAFTFLIFTLMLLMPSGLGQVNGVLMLWMLLYYFLAMKHFYAQGVFRTMAKYMVLSFGYSAAIAFGLTATALAALVLG